MSRKNTLLMSSLLAVVAACGSATEVGSGLTGDPSEGGSGGDEGQPTGNGGEGGEGQASGSGASSNGGEAGNAGGSGGGGNSNAGAGNATTGGGGTNGGAYTNSPPNPRFPGAGDGWSGAPLAPGQGPESADSCLEPPDLSKKTQVVSSGTLCFYGPDDPQAPAATVEQIVEVVDGKEMVHIRVTFDPGFVDNSYGTGSIGWSPVRGHWFFDLVGSDHVELQLGDGEGNVAMHFKLDYISQDASQPCGHGTLGVSGGDGALFVGDEADILAVTTSLDRNLNGCGYCLTQDSPATDDDYTPNPMYPDWDYRMVYEVWIDADAFGDAGFGSALIEYVHASPAKSENETIEVERQACPPDWDTPYCPPHLVDEGAACGDEPPPGAGGSSGSGGNTGTGGSNAGCPPGTVPDLESEGKFCVPE